MIVRACVLVFGGVASLIGAVITNTPKGKILNDSLTKAFELFDSRIIKYLPNAKFLVQKILGGKIC